MSTAHAAAQDLTVLGKITTAFGVKGWVKVYSYTDPMASIFDYPSWFVNIDGQWRTIKVREGKPQGKGLVAALEGVNDRDAALALSQVEIAVPTADLPELDEDEHYWFQLQGLKVFHTDGQLLGQVKELFDSGGGNQVMVISSTTDSIDSRQRMVPFVGAIVLEVDLEQGQIQVDWDPDF